MMNIFDVKKIKMDEIESIISYIGFVIICLSIFMIFPLITSYIYQDNIIYSYSFISSTITCLFVGNFLYLKYDTKKRPNLSLKGSIIFVIAIWVVTAFFSALPLMFSGDLSFIDAYFEAISGITSTGYTMYSSVPTAYSIRLWRALLQWFGGLGIIFLLLVLLPSSISLKRLYFAEGKTEQITSNIKHTSRIFIKVYMILTVISIGLYILAGLDIFNSICYAFSALGTGGFSADAANLDNFSNPLIYLVTIIIMILGGINFVIHYNILKGNWTNILKDIELRYMFIFIFLATVLISISLVQNNIYNGDILVSCRHALFQVVSVLTSTGYQTTDINIWPTDSMYILIILMFIGGGVCSTAGGIKIYNVVLMLKSIWWETVDVILPYNTIHKKRLYHDNKLMNISSDLIKVNLTYIFAYLLIFIISALIILAYCNDFQIACAIAAGSVGNTGLGPSYINTSIPLVVKLVLIFDFIAGRIGIWPVLLPISYIINKIME